VAYRRRYYKSWRSRGWSYKPSKYTELNRLFGQAVDEIKRSFLALDEGALDELLLDYGDLYGANAEKYARKTFQSWKNGSTKLSGQTMERLVSLVPPYLDAGQRQQILLKVINQNKRSGPSRTIKINLKEPESGLRELEGCLDSFSKDEKLANIPEKVMKAAEWLYDHDMTAGRAVIAEAERRENEMMRASARKEIEVLKRTILSGQVKGATYNVSLPSGTLNIVAYTPSICFVSTACYGQSAWQTRILRDWRDSFLIETDLGRRFIVWYYNDGDKIAEFAQSSKFRLLFFKAFVGVLAISLRILSVRGK